MHPIPADDIDLLLEFLCAEDCERKRIAAHLRTLLARQQSDAFWARKPIPCRRPLGLYVLLPRRLAIWLAAALESSTEELQVLRDQLSAEQDKHVVAQPTSFG